MELIIVCILIGLMMAVAAPTMRNALFSDPLKASARNIIGKVTGVRELAVRYQQPYLLHISQSESRIWYEKDGVPADSEEEEEKKLESRQVQLPEEIEINEIWIGGDGSSVEGKTVVWISKQGYMNPTKIQLQDDDGNELTVEFHPFIDSATISDRFDVPMN